MTRWFLGFDANIMVLSKTSVWVRLHNLPLTFWHHQVLEGIGNTMGKLIKADLYRSSKGIFTFSRIYVEVELSKGIDYCIHIIHNNLQWTRPLDF